MPIVGGPLPRENAAGLQELPCLLIEPLAARPPLLYRCLALQEAPDVVCEPSHDAIQLQRRGRHLQSAESVSNRFMH